MPRPPRVLVAGGTYHVYSRGNRRQEIFRSETDYQLFRGLLGRTVRRYGWVCEAYCLMPNHIHLLLHTPTPTLPRGMQWLAGTYAVYFNERYSLSGHLFQGRYGSVLVEREEHALELARYIVLNPVRAGLCTHPAEWPWSSYRACAGLERAPRWLSVRRVLAAFGRGKVAHRAYAAFVAEADD